MERIFPLHIFAHFLHIEQLEIGCKEVQIMQKIRRRTARQTSTVRRIYWCNVVLEDGQNIPFGSYESVGRGFESLPSHQNPTRNRKISRGIFLFYDACTFLHIPCTSAGNGLLSVHCVHGALFTVLGELSQANSARVNSRRSSALICRMASKIICPVTLAASGVSFCGWFSLIGASL